MFARAASSWVSVSIVADLLGLGGLLLASHSAICLQSVGVAFVVLLSATALAMTWSSSSWKLYTGP